jgi:Catechol dioxygenase N terminus
VPYVTEDDLSDVVLERWNVVREVEPTQAEWATGIDWLTRTGQMCSQKRQEFIMASDVLGVSMLVDAIKDFAGVAILTCLNCQQPTNRTKTASVTFGAAGLSIEATNTNELPT